MKLFKCTNCGQLLYFENGRCEQCGDPLGFEAESLQLIPVIPQGHGLYKNHDPHRDPSNSKTYRYCSNYGYGVCNWLVAENNGTPFCKACSLNRTIPNLSRPEYLERWKIIEGAKHRLVYSLLRMKLPLGSHESSSRKGLSFDFVADEQTDGSDKILTGHDDGLITINIAEADDIERETARKSMDEVYRTVLGHFRHEVGHYYWDRLIESSEYLEEFRELFGDERKDYGEALKVHYEHGAPPEWNLHFISTYATTHPWEDWAESWAHYLHIIDTLETANAFGLKIKPQVMDDSSVLKADIKADPYDLKDFNEIIKLWLPLTFAMNSLNRSMGLHDLYPFVIRPKVMQKLKFIHKVCYITAQQSQRVVQHYV
ncbi:MAG: putative zinc-binding peptidase [Chitinophagaceae bacterium]